MLENIDAQTRELNKYLFKEMEDYHWFRGVISSMKDYSAMSTTFTLVVRIQRHQRVIDGCQQIIEGRDIGAQHSLSDLDILHSHNQRSQWELVASCIRSLREKTRPMLYEFDPRIGQTVKWQETLPELEWFDPPENIQPLWEGQPDVTPYNKPCPLCSKPFDPFNPPMWTGGNMRWAHMGCWTKGMKRVVPTARTLSRL